MEPKTFVVSLFDGSENRKWQEVAHSFQELDLIVIKYSDFEDISIEIEEESTTYA